MARSREGLGEAMSERLLARAGKGLHRRTMEDGGSVFSGHLVDRAMRAMGGRMRGFTMDHSIFMPSSFDPSRAEDQATYAHERWHQRHSGGDTGGGRHGAQPDLEEAQARHVEQMVLHRLEEGEGLSTAMRDTAPEGATGAQEGATEGATGETGGETDPLLEGYRALRDQGMSHEEIVSELASWVVASLGEQQLDRLYRTGPPSAV